MDRRSFLRPGRLAEEAGRVAAAWREGAAPADVALVQYSRPAMATRFTIQCPPPADAAAQLRAAEKAFDRIDAVERHLTVYREGSETGRLNRAAGSGWVEVSRPLFGLLLRCAALSRRTRGAFDPTSGALTKAWGFYRRAGRVPAAKELAAALRRTGMRHVRFDRRGLRVRFARPGVELNFGAVGKGYALDRAGRRLRREFGVTRAMLHSGSSSVLAMGPPADGRSGWRVRVKHPWDASRDVAEVTLRRRAMATSAATFQHFEHDGKTLGHIIDPRTGRPAEGLAQVSVFAPTAERADALATAFFTLGLEAAADFCHTHRKVAALILPAGDGARPVAVNLQPHEYRLLD